MSLPSPPKKRKEKERQLDTMYKYGVNFYLFIFFLGEKQVDIDLAICCIELATLHVIYVAL